MINMTQLAKIAGVSVATVSRVFNNPEKVKPELRRHVQHIARQHNYIYNAAAADLKRRKSKIIGVVFPTTIGPLFAQTLTAIHEEIQAKGMSLIFGNTQYSISEERRLIQQFQERRVSGIIFTGFGFGQEQHIRDLMAQDIRCVVTHDVLDDSDIDYVGFDNLTAAYEATQFLLNTGHKRIGLIIGPYDKMPRIQKRFKGYRQAIEDSGREFDPGLVIATEPEFIEGKHAMSQLIALPKPPTAVFAVSDHLAVGALSAAKQAGMRVPDDLSIIGFDGVEFTAFCDPPITTVKVPAYDIGRLAARMLLEAIEQESRSPAQYCLDADLIVRKSCRELKG